LKISGKLAGLAIDFESRQALLTIAARIDPERIRKYSGTEIDIEIAAHKEKRSLSANAYFHVLCGKISQAVKRSQSYVKNQMIAGYGQPEIIDGELVYIKTQIPVDQMMEQESLHCQHCGTEMQGSMAVQWYRVYRGSHTYDTTEMAMLIDGTIGEAQALGIETLTPEQIDRMLAAYHRNYEKKQKEGKEET